MKKGDLVRYEYVTRHPSGVGWEFHKGVGIITGCNAEQGSFKIIAQDGRLIERLDIQLEILCPF